MGERLFSSKRARESKNRKYLPVLAQEIHRKTHTQNNLLYIFFPFFYYSIMRVRALCSHCLFKLLNLFPRSLNMNRHKNVFSFLKQYDDKTGGRPIVIIEINGKFNHGRWASQTREPITALCIKLFMACRSPPDKVVDYHVRRRRGPRKLWTRCRGGHHHHQTFCLYAKLLYTSKT